MMYLCVPILPFAIFAKDSVIVTYSFYAIMLAFVIYKLLVLRKKFPLKKDTEND